MTCVLSRVSLKIEESKGPENCELEIAIADTFFKKAHHRMRANFKAMDNNEDEPMKFIADKMCELGKYPYDILK